jgi:transcriptional regulator GlxA family with amidase domain
VQARVSTPRALLAAGGAPATVAQELGFEDQRHFHNALRERVAAAPGDSRR